MEENCRSMAGDWPTVRAGVAMNSIITGDGHIGRGCVSVRVEGDIGHESHHNSSLCRMEAMLDAG